MKNRFIIALLIMVLTGMFLSIHAMAEPELPNADPERFECYPNGDGTWTVAYYNGQDPNVNLAIPITYDELEGGVITIIDKSAFHNQYYFTGRLIIPESIVEIRKRAFEGCYGLSGDFIIPDSVEIIGEHAFDGCTGFSGDLVIPDTVKELGGYAFAGCTGFNGTLSISKNLEVINMWCFQGCSGLTGSLNISDNVTKIGAHAFEGCKNIEGSLQFPKDLTSIGAYAFQDCSGLTGSLILPERLDNIGACTFKGCTGLTGEIIVPASVYGVGANAFEGCAGITDIIILNGVHMISLNAFKDCKALSAIWIPSSVTEISGTPFEGWDSLSKIYCAYPSTAWDKLVEKGVEDLLVPWDETIPDQSMLLLSHINDTGERTVAEEVSEGYMPLLGTWEIESQFPGEPNEVEMTETTLRIDDKLYNVRYTGDKIEALDKEGNTVSVYRWKMYEQDRLELTWRVLAEGVDDDVWESHTASYRRDGDNPEENSGLLSLPIVWPDVDPNGNPLIGGWHMDSASNGAVEPGIENYLVIDAEAFRIIKVSGTEIVEDNATGYTADGTVVDVEGGARLKYAITGNTMIMESDYTDVEGNPVVFELSRVETDSAEQETVPVSADGSHLEWFQFEEGKNGTCILKKYIGPDINDADIMIPQKDAEGRPVTVIGKEAFECNGSLNGRLILQEGITQIDDLAFYQCGFSGDLVIPDSVTSIGKGAFSYCRNFNGKLVLSKGLNKIEKSAFSWCDNFTGDLIIPAGVESIGEDAFLQCCRFNGSLVLPEGLKSIGSCAFFGCNGLTGELILPDSVNKINDEAFCHCSGFKGALKIPEGITFISENCFLGCSGLTDVCIPDGVVTISSGAFRGCSGLKKLVLPDSLKGIKEQAFTDCNGLTGDLIIPSGVNSIGNKAFEHCNGFNGILVIPASVTDLGGSALTDVFSSVQKIYTVRDNSTWKLAESLGYSSKLVEIDSLNMLELPNNEYTETITEEREQMLPQESGSTEEKPVPAAGQQGAAASSESTDVPSGEYSQMPDEESAETIEQEPALNPDQIPDEEYTEEIEQAPTQESSPVEESPVADALPVNPLIDGKRQVPVSSVRADSYISGSKESYPPENMVDGDETTTWQFSTKQNKLKETYVYFSFPEPVTIDELWIKNGFWKITSGKDQYTRNSRIKELGIAFLYADSADYADKQTIKLKDDKKRNDWQKIELGAHQNVTGIRFRIMSIYQGSKFKHDVCVSEVMFMNSEQ